MSVLTEPTIVSAEYQTNQEELLADTVTKQVEKNVEKQMLGVLKDFFPNHSKWDSLPEFSPNATGAREIRLAKTVRSWNGNFLPKYPLGNPEITILKYIVQPGTKLDMHKHPVISAGYIISGELTIISQMNERSYLTTGDSFVELVDTWHFGQNESDEPVEIIIFYAGVEEAPITIYEDQDF